MGKKRERAGIEKTVSGKRSKTVRGKKGKKKVCVRERDLRECENLPKRVYGEIGENKRRRESQK